MVRFLGLALTLCLLSPGSVLLAQGNGGGGNGGGGTGGNGGNGNGNQGGILIDANGVVKPLFAKPGNAALTQKRLAELAANNLPADLNKPSELRKISLVRLEAAYADLIRQGQPIPEEMQYLAGLTRIDHLFVYPETGDVVIAGPASGFAPDELGRMRSVTSNRPPLRLEHLIVALRTVPGGETIRCSIDPVPQNLANLKRYIASTRGATSVAVARSRYPQMANILGLQTVTTGGVPADSHFALTLVEADLRMKLISMGLEKPPVPRFRTHLSMITPGGNSMQRWWFVPLYEELTVSDDGLAYKLSGQRAQLLSQDELVGANGNRSAAATTRLSTEKYAKQFTEKFPELAAAVPSFAELQNLIDLSIIAAIMKQQQIPKTIDWPIRTFLDPDRSPLASYPVPKRVPSSFSYRMSGRSMVLGLIGGGVTIQYDRIVKQIPRTVDSEGRLAGIRVGAGRDTGPEAHPWWWD